MSALKSKIILIFTVILCLPAFRAQSRPLLARPEISVLQSDNIIISYETFKRKSEFITIQEDVFFKAAMLTFSRRIQSGFEYSLSAGAGYSDIRDYVSADGDEINSLKTSRPGYIFSAEISKDISGDLIIFPQWRAYLRIHQGYFSFDQVDGNAINESIDLQSSIAETALLVSKQWYPFTLYGALKFSYIEDLYKYTEGRARKSCSARSILTPLIGIKYNFMEKLSLRGEFLAGADFGESGFTSAINFEF